MHHAYINTQLNRIAECVCKMKSIDIVYQSFSLLMNKLPTAGLNVLFNQVHRLLNGHLQLTMCTTAVFPSAMRHHCFTQNACTTCSAARFNVELLYDLRTTGIQCQLISFCRHIRRFYLIVCLYKHDAIENTVEVCVHFIQKMN